MSWQKYVLTKETLKKNNTTSGNVPLHRQTEKFKQGVKWVISENLQSKLDMVETNAILSDLFVRIEILHIQEFTTNSPFFQAST
jgi:hypothetical protein